MADMMVEEFKAEHPDQYENDVNTKSALNTGFKSYKSDSVDYFLEHHETFPLTLVLFYDSGMFDEGIMRGLTQKLLDVFVYKYEKKLEKGNFNFKANNSDDLSKDGAPNGASQSSFDQALSLIYEDVRYPSS